jgi:hypothetical protein
MADDDALCITQLRIAICEGIQPVAEVGPIGIRELWVEHLFAAPAELVNQPPLPVIVRPLVTEPVQHEEPATDRLFFRWVDALNEQDRSQASVRRALQYAA